MVSCNVQLFSLVIVCDEIPAPTMPGTTNSSDGTNIRFLNATMSFTCPENLTTANLMATQNISCIEDGSGNYRFDPETLEECNGKKSDKKQKNNNNKLDYI